MRIVTMVTLLALGGAASAAAQSSHLGPRFGYNLDAEAITLGAQLSVPVARRVEFYPSFDYHAVDVGSLFSINADVKVRMGDPGFRGLYLGTGLGVRRRSVGDFDNTDLNANLFAGLESRWGKVHPFGEIRLGVGDETEVQLLIGFNFTLSGR